MITIWKYPLRVKDTQLVAMPKGARILSVGVQTDTICLWAMVDDREGETVYRRILIVGTGNPVFEAEDGKFIGTVQLYGGRLVFHVFEEETR